MFRFKCLTDKNFKLNFFLAMASNMVCLYLLVKVLKKMIERKYQDAHLLKSQYFSIHLIFALFLSLNVCLVYVLAHALLHEISSLKSMMHF